MDQNKKRIFLITILIVVLLAAFQKHILPIEANATILPGMKWPDNNGVHINAHGGGVIKVGELFYWFGEHKVEGGKGNKAQVGVHCYSSSDLAKWTDEGIALSVVTDNPDHPIAIGSVIERPKVIYNEKTDSYIMWFHLELKGQGYSSAMTGVAKSKNVTGPYEFVRALRPNKKVWPVGYPDSLKIKNYEEGKLKGWSTEWIEAVKQGMFLKRDYSKGQMSRDMALFVDTDGKAYHIHAAEENLTLHISLLTDDYLGFTDTYYRVLPTGHNEAPTMFIQGGKYYMITSGCTGWDPNAARLLAADSISGEWIYLKNPCVGENAGLTFGSQSTFVLPLGKEKFIFMADQWAPGNPIEGRYVWLPMEYDSEGLPMLKWYDEWNIKKYNSQK